MPGLTQAQLDGAVKDLRQRDAFVQLAEIALKATFEALPGPEAKEAAETALDLLLAQTKFFREGVGIALSGLKVEPSAEERARE